MSDQSVTGYWIHIDWRMMRMGFLIATFPFAASWVAIGVAHFWQFWTLRKSVRHRP